MFYIRLKEHQKNTMKKTPSKPFFIKTEMISLLKFCPKLNEMSCQHQSYYATCHINYFLIFFFKLYFFKKKLKIKNFAIWHRASLGVGSHPTSGWKEILGVVSMGLILLIAILEPTVKICFLLIFMNFFFLPLQSLTP
jgi:hypothetical protein